MKIKNPSFVLIFVVTSILVFIVCVNQPIDPDMWWHLRNGQETLSQGSISTVDLFSFTRFNQPWTNAFWLSDLFIYAIYQIGGFWLLLTIFAALGTLTYMIIFLFSPGPFLLRAFLVVLAAISTSPEWTIRPQVTSFLILSIVNIYLIQNSDLNWKKFIWLPLLFILWANIHGGYIWGILLLFAVIIGRFLDHYLFKNITVNKSELAKFSLFSFLSFFFVLFNPNGLAILKLPFKTIDVSIASIMEWSSPNFHEMIMLPFLMVIILFIIVLSIAEKRLSSDQLIKALGFLILAFISQRNIPLAVIVILPILIEKFSEFISTYKNGKSIKSEIKVPAKVSAIINSIIVLFLVLACGARIYAQSSASEIQSVYPVQAVEWILENKPKGNIFNSYNWGGFLIFNLPEYKVFIDGRADLYGNELIATWWNIVNDRQNSLESLDKYNINLILLEPDRPIVERLIEQNWTLSYQDGVSVILTR